MIHAYLWIGGGRLDRDGHGPSFLSMAHKINAKEGGSVKITPYHTFHEEVREARKHVWKCDGPCKHRPPYFGIVRRAMNRPPQPADRWWSEHQASCSGKFTKIDGPPIRNSKVEVKGRDHDIRGYWKGKPNFAKDDNIKGIQCPACRNYLADNLDNLNLHLDICLSDDKVDICDDERLCPVCEAFMTFDLDLLNDHIEGCLIEVPLGSCEGTGLSTTKVIDLT
jgi:hypothetical protein